MELSKIGQTQEDSAQFTSSRNINPKQLKKGKYSPLDQDSNIKTSRREQIQYEIEKRK